MRDATEPERWDIEELCLIALDKTFFGNSRRCFTVNERGLYSADYERGQRPREVLFTVIELVEEIKYLDTFSEYYVQNFVS